MSWPARWPRAGARRCRARVSRFGLRPPLTRHPADVLAHPEVDEAGGVFLRQGRDPFLQALLGQLGGLRVRAPEGVPKQGTPATLDLMASSLLEELALVFF